MSPKQNIRETLDFCASAKARTEGVGFRERSHRGRVAKMRTITVPDDEWQAWQQVVALGAKIDGRIPTTGVSALVRYAVNDLIARIRDERLGLTTNEGRP